MRLTWLLAIIIRQSNHRVDLKPYNILLTTPELDEVAMRELTERPTRLYNFPKAAQHKEAPITPVMSAPLYYTPRDESPPFHWVITGFGRGTLARRLLLATNELEIPQRTSS